MTTTIPKANKVYRLGNAIFREYFATGTVKVQDGMITVLDMRGTEHYELPYFKTVQDAYNWLVEHRDCIGCDFINPELL